LTRKATCGLQKMAVAYQFPRAVVGSSTAGITGYFTRSSSFLVPWIVYTGTSVPGGVGRAESSSCSRASKSYQGGPAKVACLHRTSGIAEPPWHITNHQMHTTPEERS